MWWLRGSVVWWLRGSVVVMESMYCEVELVMVLLNSGYMSTWKGLKR